MLTPVIENAVTHLYEAFANVPKPHMIDGCPCCIERREVDKLLSTPIKDISPGQLAPYASAAMLTVGSAEDLRYFLPRILEIRTSDWGWWPNVEVIFGALAEAKWHEWPAPEQEAVRQLVSAVIQQFLESDNEYMADEIDSWLCAIARAGDSAVPYFEQMFAEGHVEKVRQIHELNANSLMKGKLTNNFWAAPGRREVVTWFERPDVKDSIAHAYRKKHET